MRGDVKKRAAWLALAGLVVASQLGSGVARGDLFSLNGNDERVPPGVYYPGPFYSRQYLQDFPLRPDQAPIYYRLIPFEHYGQYRLGTPVPGLTTGHIHSNRFVYRYRYGFEPVVCIPPVYDECQNLRHVDRPGSGQR